MTPEAQLIALRELDTRARSLTAPEPDYLKSYDAIVSLVKYLVGQNPAITGTVYLNITAVITSFAVGTGTTEKVPMLDRLFPPASLIAEGLLRATKKWK
jgi:hypothetical protein